MLLLIIYLTLIIATISSPNEYQTEKLDSPITGSGDIEVNGKTMQYNIQDDKYIVEGDIIIGPVSPVRRRLVPVMTNGAFWINSYIPYEIHPSLSPTMVSRINAAISHWERNTNIRLRSRNGETDYVQFVPDTGCASFIGRIGGKQEIFLNDRCSIGNTIHEIGHCIGFWHTHSREDRNLFIAVNWLNIIPGRENAFRQHIDDADDCLTYDYGSIMHYGLYGFTKNGIATIRPLKNTNGVTIGQRNGLSKIDIACARISYPHIECITSCTGLANGNYHSCNGCNVFATCCEQMLIDNRDCAPANPLLEYDYLLDACVYSGDSQTCHGSQLAKSVLNNNDVGVYSSVKIEKKTNPMFRYISVTGLILFILINNIFIGCWCLRKRNHKNHGDLCEGDMLVQ